MSNVRTTTAFDTFRQGRQPRIIDPGIIRRPGDEDQMTRADGLESWQDGSAKTSPDPSPPVPIKVIEQALKQNLADKRLWVVVEDDVLHAPEHCPFGSQRDAGVVKHSNLTGGGTAFAGGELVHLDDNSVALNGCSGRYRMTDEQEARSVVKAFCLSGYDVWWTGWDEGTRRTPNFGVIDLERVTP